KALPVLKPGHNLLMPVRDRYWRIVWMQRHTHARLLRNWNHRFKEIREILPEHFRRLWLRVAGNILSPFVIKSGNARTAAALDFVIPGHQSVCIKVIFHDGKSNLSRSSQRVLNVPDLLVPSFPTIDRIGMSTDHQIGRASCRERVSGAEEEVAFKHEP